MIETQIFNEIMADLRKEAGHYQRLRELGEEQKTVLVAGDLQKLPEIVRASEKEVFALGPLHASRAQRLAILGRQMGIQEPTLDTIAERAPLEVRDDFAGAIREVVQAAKNLDDVNRGNEKLLENAVNYVNFTLNALSEGGKPKSTYTPASLKPAVPAQQAASMLNRVV